LATEQQLIDAIHLAMRIHARDVDKNGFPYILHLFRVMEGGKTNLEKIVRVLHDAVEDHAQGGVTFDSLREIVGDEPIPYLRALTHTQGERYDRYIDRVLRAGMIAVTAKMDDLKDNLSVARMLFETHPDTGEPTRQALDRIKKYRRAYARLAEYAEQG
jgi:hypothetical protein